METERGKWDYSADAAYNLYPFSCFGSKVVISRLLWKYFFNFPSLIQNIGVAIHGLSDLSQEIADGLNTNGFYVSDVTKLGLEEQFLRLEELEHERGSSRGTRVPVPTRYSFLNEPIKEAIEHYCGVRLLRWEQARFVHSAHGDNEEPILNSKWHIDVEDFHVIKLFVFISDVSQSRGPTEYVRGTHPKGKFARQVMNYRGPNISADLSNHIVPLTGPRGTVAIFDSRGLHRGGYFKSDGLRDVFAESFISPYWMHRQRGIVEKVFIEMYGLDELAPRMNDRWFRFVEKFQRPCRPA